MRWLRVLMVLVLLVCLAPLFCMAVAEVIARINGCKLDLVSAHPCIVGGQDIGDTLLTLGSMGYFLMATLPWAMVVVAAWIIIEIIAWVRRRAARSGRTPA